MIEKRRFNRVPFQKPVEIYPVFPSYSDSEESNEASLKGIALDLSGGGVALKISQEMKVGSFLKLRFEMEQDQMVEAFGEIVWVRQALCGLSFTPDSDFSEGDLLDFVSGLRAQ